MINLIRVKWDSIIVALWQHITLTILSLCIASLISIFLAILALKYRKISNIILQITGILQTIPSLAILAIMIPIVGIGFPAALTALVIYALLPIFQNTFIGLNNTDKTLIESAKSLGLSNNQILWKIRFPLAKDNIIAGLRTAVVMIVGTATLAALIGAGGLGTFILLGIDRNNTNLILIGAILSAILAIIFTNLIKLIGNFKFKFKVIIISVILIITTIGNIIPNMNTHHKNEIVIAGKLGSEPSILINMYKDLLIKSNPKLNIVLKSNFGNTSFLYNALKSNNIDIYPEFTGTIISDIYKANVPRGSSSHKTYDLAKYDANKMNLKIGKPMKFNDTYAIAVKKIIAKKYGLYTIGDLRKLDDVKAGMTAEFLNRTDGWPLIKTVYKLNNVNTISFDPSLRYKALNQNKVLLTDAYSTNSNIEQYKLKILKDNKHVFPVYQAVPIMNKKFNEKNPEIIRILDKLNNKITNKQMQKMNYLVNVKHDSPKKVAKHFLIKNNLI